MKEYRVFNKKRSKWVVNYGTLDDVLFGFTETKNDAHVFYDILKDDIKVINTFEREEEYRVDHKEVLRLRRSSDELSKEL